MPWSINGQNVVRKLLFIVFFSIGAAALCGSILCDDLARYYQNRRLLEDAQKTLDSLKLLNLEYDVLLKQLEEDPNLLKRIAPAALGTEQQEPNTVHPKASPKLLAAVRKLLKEKSSTNADTNMQNSSLRIQESDDAVPAWLSRCSRPRQRMGLFLAGAGTILISLICFGPIKRKPDKAKSDYHAPEL